MGVGVYTEVGLGVGAGAEGGCPGRRPQPPRDGGVCGAYATAVAGCFGCRRRQRGGVRRGARWAARLDHEECCREQHSPPE